MTIGGEGDAKSCCMAAGWNETLDRASWKEDSGCKADDGDDDAGLRDCCTATDHRDAFNRASRIDREGNTEWMAIDYGEEDAEDCYTAAGRDEIVNRAFWTGDPGWMANDDGEVTASLKDYDCIATDCKDTVNQTFQVI